MKLLSYLWPKLQQKQEASLFHIEVSETSIQLQFKLNYRSNSASYVTNTLLVGRKNNKKYYFNMCKAGTFKTYEIWTTSIPKQLFKDEEKDTWDAYIFLKNGYQVRIKDPFTPNLESSLFQLDKNEGILFYSTINGNLSIKSTQNRIFAIVDELRSSNKNGFILSGKVFGLMSNGNPISLILENRSESKEYKLSLKVFQRDSYIYFSRHILAKDLEKSLLNNKFKLYIELYNRDKSIKIPLEKNSQVNRIESYIYLRNYANLILIQVNKNTDMLSIILTSQKFYVEISNILVDIDRIFLSGFIINNDNISLNGLYEVIIKRRDRNEDIRDIISIQDNHFNYLLDIGKHLKDLMMSNGIWDIYININKEWIRCTSRTDGIENKRSIVNIPQMIIPNGNNENKAVKVYYTLHEEVSILIRNHIVTKRLDAIYFKKRQLIIEGLLNIIVLHLNKTNRTALEFAYKIIADLSPEIKAEAYENMNFDLTECTIRFQDYISVFYINLIPSKVVGSFNSYLSRNKKIQQVTHSIKLKLYYLMNTLLPVNSKYIIFQSTTGMNYSCNPRGIYEELIKQKVRLKPVWILNNTNVKIEGSPRIVKPNSIKYYYYLSIGKYFINNGNFPDFYKKRKHTIHIQTWHGTPLKKLGFDISPKSPSYKENTSKALQRRIARWDYLVSPNSYTANILKRAYRFKNEMLPVGYPRNDILYESQDVKQKLISEVKSYLNLPDDKKVILYAPTWRDNEFHSGLINEPYDFKFNLEEFIKNFSDEYVLLLRLHPRDSLRCQIKEYEHVIFNVTQFDDIKFLYLVSDVLVTDYSSVMFDFANTKKPMIFFTHDIKKYASTLRGFYFNLYHEAPGPIVTNQSDLFSVLKISDKLPELYKNKYYAFYEKYCSWEDGKASRRIIDNVIKKIG